MAQSISLSQKKFVKSDNIFDALKNRRCYATTGDRILLEFSIDGLQMGECENKSKKDKLSIGLKVWGTDSLLRMEILRFRFNLNSAFIPILSDFPNSETTDASYDIEDEFIGRCMYYARIMQSPLSWPDMAWTSPIWIEDMSK